MNEGKNVRVSIWGLPFSETNRTENENSNSSAHAVDVIADARR